MSHNRSLTANSVRLTLAAAIVIHDDCVLIVRRSKKEKFMPREWGVPCGKIHARDGERARDAVLRELHEETRLTGEIVKFVGQQEFESIWHGRSARNIQYNYLISLKISKRTLRFNRMPRVKTPKRDQESKWIPLDKIAQQDLDDHNREAIRQGLEAYESGPDKSSEAMASSFRR
jgi:8-oxo-dGTP diphosphatase